MPYKQRLIIEGFDCSQNLFDPGFALDFLERLTEALDMRVLVPPVVVRVPVTCAADRIKTQDQGITGFVIWMESGAQLHTWPGEGVATLDAYSCRPFRVSTALAIFYTAFEPSSMKFGSPQPLEDAV